jgi:hypothetical protein
MVVVLSLPSMSVSEEFTPQFNPQIDIHKTSGDINIDGNLNDPGWEGATLITHFVEHRPGDQLKPPVETAARITYDDNNFYLSSICYDNPEEIRATFCDRDQLVGNDVIVLLIDTYAEASRAYHLYVNPLGIQTDALWNPNGSDFSYNIIYETAGKITESGYQIEMAVPFSSLHFPNNDIQTWKFDILRIRPRESWCEYSAVAHDRNNPCIPCQWATLTGLKNIKPARGMEVLPSFLGYQSGEGIGNLTPESPYRFVNSDPKGELGLNLKYKPFSNIAIEATINPDYSQIEPDMAQMDLNTTDALSYPERRPFFQEASELFSTWRMTYYSRMINNPKAAFKASGKIGKSSFGYLSGYDEKSPFFLSFEEASIMLTGGESFSNVARFRHTLGEDSYAGILVTDRRLKGGGSGTVASIDAQIRLHENWRFQSQVQASHINEPDNTGPDNTDLNSQIGLYIDGGWVDSTFDEGKHTSIFDGESFSGRYLMFNIEERSRHLNFDAAYIEVSPSFRSDIGLLRRSNWRRYCIYSYYLIDFDKGLLERIQPSFDFEYTPNFEGQEKHLGAYFGMYLKFLGQINIGTYYDVERDNFRNTQFDNIWQFTVQTSKSFSEKLDAKASYGYGNQISRSRLVMGKQQSLNLYAYFRPSDRLLIEPDYDYLKSVNTTDNSTLYEGYIFRTRVNYHFNREFNIRLIVQYNDIYETLNIDPMITYRLNPFTVFYLGTTYEYCDLIGTENGFVEKDTYLNKRQFYAKLQYLLQF